ncbi:MAG: hypothetical protein M3270_07110 [Thermoproteota archaeon]|nr:hypothetical protein [Thermoproteota archaeon]
MPITTVLVGGRVRSSSPGFEIAISVTSSVAWCFSYIEQELNEKLLNNVE